MVNLMLSVEPPVALEIVHCMAQVCGDTEAEAELVLSTYQEMLTSDRSFLVPILGSISDLHLPDRMKGEVFQMAHESLDIVDEGDYPAILRTLLATLTATNANKLLSTVRSDSENLSPHTITLVTEVTANYLRLHHSSSALFLSSLERASKLHVIDAILFIVLLSNPHERERVWRSFVTVASSGALRLNTLVRLLEQEEYVGLLKSYSNSLLFLCRMLLQKSVESSDSGKESATDTYTLVESPLGSEWAKALFEAVFRAFPSSRLDVVKTLLLSSTSTSRSTVAHKYTYRKSGHTTVPSSSSSSSSAVPSSSSSSTTASSTSSRRRRATGPASGAQRPVIQSLFFNLIDGHQPSRDFDVSTSYSAASSNRSSQSAYERAADPKTLSHEADVASDILFKLCNEQAMCTAMSIYSHFVEETIRYPESLHLTVIYRLTAILARMCLVKPTLKSPLMVYVQKMLFQPSLLPRLSGLALATELVCGVLSRTAMETEESTAEEVQSILSWVLRLLPPVDSSMTHNIETSTADWSYDTIVCSSLVFRMLARMAPSLPCTTVVQVLDHVLRPLLFQLGVLSNDLNNAGPTGSDGLFALRDSSGSHSPHTISLSYISDRVQHGLDPRNYRTLIMLPSVMTAWLWHAYITYCACVDDYTGSSLAADTLSFGFRLPMPLQTLWGLLSREDRDSTTLLSSLAAVLSSGLYCVHAYWLTLMTLNHAASRPGVDPASLVSRFASLLFFQRVAYQVLSVVHRLYIKPDQDEMEDGPSSSQEKKDSGTKRVSGSTPSGGSRGAGTEQNQQGLGQEGPSKKKVHLSEPDGVQKWVLADCQNLTTSLEREIAEGFPTSADTRCRVDMPSMSAGLVTKILSLPRVAPVCTCPFQVILSGDSEGKEEESIEQREAKEARIVSVLEMQVCCSRALRELLRPSFLAATLNSIYRHEFDVRARLALSKPVDVSPIALAASPSTIPSAAAKSAVPSGKEEMDAPDVMEVERNFPSTSLLEGKMNGIQAFMWYDGSGESEIAVVLRQLVAAETEEKADEEEKWDRSIHTSLLRKMAFQLPLLHAVLSQLGKVVEMANGGKGNSSSSSGLSSRDALSSEDNIHIAMAMSHSFEAEKNSNRRGATGVTGMSDGPNHPHPQHLCCRSSDCSLNPSGKIKFKVSLVRVVRRTLVALQSLLTEDLALVVEHVTQDDVSSLGVSRDLVLHEIAGVASNRPSGSLVVPHLSSVDTSASILAAAYKMFAVLSTSEEIACGCLSLHMCELLTRGLKKPSSASRLAFHRLYFSYQCTNAAFLQVPLCSLTSLHRNSFLVAPPISSFTSRKKKKAAVALYLSMRKHLVKQCWRMNRLVRGHDTVNDAALNETVLTIDSVRYIYWTMLCTSTRLDIAVFSNALVKQLCNGVTSPRDEWKERVAFQSMTPDSAHLFLTLLSSTLCLYVFTSSLVKPKTSCFVSAPLIFASCNYATLLCSFLRGLSTPQQPGLFDDSPIMYVYFYIVCVCVSFYTVSLAQPLASSDFSQPHLQNSFKRTVVGLWSNSVNMLRSFQLKYRQMFHLVMTPKDVIEEDSRDGSVDPDADLKDLLAVVALVSLIISLLEKICTKLKQSVCTLSFFFSALSIPAPSSLSLSPFLFLSSFLQFIAKGYLNDPRLIPLVSPSIFRYRSPWSWPRFQDLCLKSSSFGASLLSCMRRIISIDIHLLVLLRIAYST